MTPVTVCEPCGASSWEVVHRDVMGRGADLRRCLACGFKTYDRVVYGAEMFYTAPAYDEYADTSFRFKTSVTAQQRDELAAGTDVAVRSMYGAIVARIEAAVPRRPLRLYEFGCGWGRLLDVARGRGHVVSGCDWNAHEAANGRSLGLDVVAGDFLALLIAGSFDAVVGLDVIEHVWQPRAVIERAVSLLEPGGVLLLKTFYDEYHAAIDLDLSAGAATLGDSPRSHGYFDPVAHPSHFDLPVLRALLVRCGLVIAWEHLDTPWGQVTILGRRP